MGTNGIIVIDKPQGWTSMDICAKLRGMYREKRIGTVEKLDENTYRFSADVYDSSEMIPWIRTFICRIVKMNFSNRSVENQFKKDLEAMYWMYNVKEEVRE